MSTRSPGTGRGAPPHAVSEEPPPVSSLPEPPDAVALAAGDPVRALLVPAADEQLAERLLPLLSDDERARVGAIRTDRARVKLVVARAVLRDTLGRVLGCAPREVPLGATSTGKPVLVGVDGPQVTLTHADGLVLAAWHPVLPVGIDAERADRSVDPALVERTATTAEREALSRLAAASRASGFLRLWVRKEAVAKADGRGLALPFCDLEVLGGRALVGDALSVAPLRVEVAARSGRADVGGAPEPATGAEGRVAGEPGAGDVGWVRDLDVGDGHLAALATIGAPAEVELRPWAGVRGG